MDSSQHRPEPLVGTTVAASEAPTDGIGAGERPAPGEEPFTERGLRLGPVEQRVLGCLVEKERTTPDDYPLTANALMRAANQTTNRDPVLDLSAAEVEAACSSLKALGLLRFVHTPSGRATVKYRQVLSERLGVEENAAALIALLLLRGPQTAGELKARSERLARFVGLDDLGDTLRSLVERADPLVVLLPRRPGQKEARWAHLLGDEPTLPPTDDAAPDQPRVDTSDPDQVEALRAEVMALREQVTLLQAAVGELRSDLGLEPLAAVGD